MKIVNYDVSDALADRIDKVESAYGLQHFILKTLRCLERKYYPYCFHQEEDGNNQLPTEPIWTFEHYDYSNVSILVHTIPIYLRNSNQRDRKAETSIIDFLGAYFNNRNGQSPYIELYMKEISDTAGADDQHYLWLFTSTLIHELAHAAMDIFNRSNNQCQYEKVSYNTPFGKWREESMANAVALRIIKDSGNRGFYYFARKFMLSQPPEYALGVKMVNFSHDDFRSVIYGKENGVDIIVQNDWLKYANGKPTWGGLQKWNGKLMPTRVIHRYVLNGNKKKEFKMWDIVCLFTTYCLDGGYTISEINDRINDYAGTKKRRYVSFTPVDSRRGRVYTKWNQPIYVSNQWFLSIFERFISVVNSTYPDFQVSKK